MRKRLYSRTAERAEEFAAEFGIPKYFGSHAALAADPDTEAVYVAAPNQMHFDLVRLCLESGKHVLCEKPLTTCREESEKLYSLAKEKHVFLMEAYWVSFLPLFERLRETIASGAVGELRRMECRYGFVASGPRRLTKLKPELGGGALMDIGIYGLGFLMLAKGTCPQYKEGSAEYCEFSTDEACRMEFSWEDGCTAGVTLSLKEKMDREAILVGTKGRIALPDFQHAERYTVYENGKEPVEVFCPEEPGGFAREIHEASACVEAGKWFSETFSPEMSLALIGLMDEIRKDWKRTEEA